MSGAHIHDLIQRRRNLKNKLRRCRKVFAAWNSFYHPSITEIFAKTGVDFIGIDIEHSTISQEQSQRIMAATQGLGSLSLPRIATHNKEMIKRLLDSGADGIIVPWVESRQQVEEILSWCLYPPAGERSFGVARAQGYGLDYDAYTKSWNGSMTLIIQIESRRAVEDIESILDGEGVDGVMIGPYDISGSLGIPGQLEHPKVKKACEKVIAACRKVKKSCGTQIVEPNQQRLKQAFAGGYTFVVLGSDLFGLWKWAEQTQKLIKEFSRR